MRESLLAECKALLQVAGFRVRPEVRTLRVTGPDRTRFLNGMLTNDVAKLQTGGGQWSIKVNAKGRIEAVVRVRVGPDCVWLDGIEPAASRLAGTLKKFIIMDDAEVEVRSDPSLSLLGPKSEEVLRKLGCPIPPQMHAFCGWEGREVIRDCSMGLPGFELRGTDMGEFSSKLIESGAMPVSSQATEVVRVLFGWPLDGIELDEDTFPMEVSAFESAISYNKGCYVGQEVVSRAKHLGHVNYRLVGVEMIGDSDVEGRQPMFFGDDAKAVGEVRSFVWTPTGGVGLAFVHRKVLDGAVVRIGRDEARVVPLPFDAERKWRLS